MVENKMAKVAELLNLELREEFKIKGLSARYRITNIGLQCNSETEGVWYTSNKLLPMLLQGGISIIKVEQPILDDIEKDYLSSVIKPFRDDVISIKKYNNGYSNYSCIVIEVKPFGIPKEFINLPSFRSGTMYNGLEVNREYTLGELGL